MVTDVSHTCDRSFIFIVISMKIEQTRDDSSSIKAFHLSVSKNLVIDTKSEITSRMMRSFKYTGSE